MFGGNNGGTSGADMGNLAKLKDLSEREVDRLKMVAKAGEDSSITRRDLLKLGIGGAIGAAVFPGTASAGGDGDNDGELGSASNPWDTWVDTLTVNRAGEFAALGSAPTAPPSGQLQFFAQSDGFYIQDPTGNVQKVQTGSSSTGSAAYDTVVTTTSGLENAVNNAAAGESIFIKTPSTPYRTSQWLDVTVDGVTIVGESILAEDGQPLIKPADGSEVGGFRIGDGLSSDVHGVTIRNVGYHGNQSTMSSTYSNAYNALHGFYTDMADHVTLKDLYSTKEHPWHVHGGGSSVFIGRNTTNVTVSNLHSVDYGDRAVTLNGQDATIDTVIASPGFDRVVGIAGGDATVNNIVGHNIAEGSIIGVGGASVHPYGRISITNIVGYGTHRALIRVIGNGDGHIAISNGVGHNGTNAPALNITNNSNGDKARWLTISNVWVDGYNQGALTEALNQNLSNITVKDCGSTGLTVQANSALQASNIAVLGNGGDGMNVTGYGNVVVTNLRANSNDQNGLVPAGGVARQQQYKAVALESNNVAAGGYKDLNVPSNADLVFVNGYWETETLAGGRNAYNGHAYDSATPSNSPWGAREAWRNGITYFNTGNATAHKGTPGGTWIQIG